MTWSFVRVFTWPVRQWRQSLPFRAVVSTVAVTLALWLLTGWFIVGRVLGGLDAFVPAADHPVASDIVVTTVAMSALLFLPALALAMYWISLQVVKPLRSARVAAEGLAAGDPNRRMAIEGPDDCASLARSINHLASELSRRLADLDSMAHQQHQFVSDVAHELRTPLTTVRMASDVIYEARRGLSPVMARSAELLSREVDRFENLLDDLLNLSRIDSGAAVLAIDELDLAELVADEVASHAQFASSYGSTLRVDAPAPCFAQVDSMRVRRIFVNLLSNAIEHGEGHPIDVYVRGGDESVAIAVRDRGVGLTLDEQEQVFKRFWRADPSRFRVAGGTGLGLAIALENAELHGGIVDVWGAPGGGAQFRLLLPITPGAPLGVPPWPRVPPDAGILSPVR